MPPGRKPSDAISEGSREGQLRVGVIGGGTMAGVHMASLAVSARASLAGVAAKQVGPIVREVAEKSGAHVLSLEQLLVKRSLDAVVVATPTGTHAELACRAMEAGLDVFCEKPVARDLGEAGRIASVASATGAKLAVGHVVRYFPEYVAAREQVKAGKLGQVATVRLFRGTSSPALSKPWYGDTVCSGGVVLDMAVHDIDWCQWSFGPVQRVYARRSGPPAEEVAAIVLRHVCGAIAYVDASWREDRFRTELEVCGTSGMYRATGSSDAGLDVVVGQGGGSSYLPKGSQGAPAGDDPYRMELEAALAWFAGGPEPRAVLADGVAALKVVAAAEESIASGKPVELKVGC